MFSHFFTRFPPSNLSWIYFSRFKIWVMRVCLRFLLLCDSFFLWVIFVLIFLVDWCCFSRFLYSFFCRHVIACSVPRIFLIYFWNLATTWLSDSLDLRVFQEKIFREIFVFSGIFLEKDYFSLFCFSEICISMSFSVLLGLICPFWPLSLDIFVLVISCLNPCVTRPSKFFLHVTLMSCLF